MNFDQFVLDFTNPDFVKYAESYGTIAHCVESTEHFDKVLFKELQNKTCIL
jgi:acetolactate synthase-1/2/3 large subunit